MAFLDEVQVLSESAQIALLRAIENQEVIRIGNQHLSAKLVFGLLLHQMFLYWKKCKWEVFAMTYGKGCVKRKLF